VVCASAVMNRKCLYNHATQIEKLTAKSVLDLKMAWRRGKF